MRRGPMNLRSVVGENIRVLRDERRIAQDELAHRSEIHPTYLSGVETGKRNITLNVLERIARALGVSEEVLVRRRPAADAD
jgi:transcriptional regulator with XRE-family HTH domain